MHSTPSYTPSYTTFNRAVSGDFGYMANNTNCERGKWIYRNCKHLDRSLSVNQADKPSVLYRVCPVLPMGVYIVHTLLALQSEAFYCFFVCGEVIVYTRTSNDNVLLVTLMRDFLFYYHFKIVFI